MPFTFCHPVIVFPLKHSKYFSFTALIVGSMIPDFEYFIRMQLEGRYGHTLGGILYFDLPLGVLLTFLFHSWVKNPLIDNLPFFFKSRFYSYKEFDWKFYVKKHKLIVLYSLLLGVFSHLFWDAFTHKTGYFVTKIPLLKTTFIDSQIPVYTFLQHFSSLVGGLIIFGVIWRLPVNKNVINLINKKYWLNWIIIMISIIVVRFLLESEKLVVGNFIVTSISAGLLAFIFTSLLDKKGVV